MNGNTSRTVEAMIDATDASKATAEENNVAAILEGVAQLQAGNSAQFEGLDFEWMPYGSLKIIGWAQYSNATATDHQREFQYIKYHLAALCVAAPALHALLESVSKKLDLRMATTKHRSRLLLKESPYWLEPHLSAQKNQFKRTAR